MMACISISRNAKFGKIFMIQAASTSSNKFCTTPAQQYYKYGVLQPVGVSLAGHLPRDGDFKGLGRTLPARYVTTATSPTVQPSCMASVSRVRLGSGGRSAAHPPSSRRLTTATVEQQHTTSSVGFARPSQGDVAIAAVDMATTTHVSSEDDQHRVLVLEGKGRQARFHSVWLRYNCHCEQCKQKHSGQITLQAHKLSPAFTVSSARLQDGFLRVTFLEEPDHEACLPLDFLWQNDYSDSSREMAADQRKHQVSFSGPPEMSHEEIVAGPAGRLRWLQYINSVGFCLLRGVPAQDGMVKKVAELIWPLQRTIYGEVFDVVSTPKPINVAYSTAELAFHMDLMYYESPPGLQFLHCLRFDESVEGGDSLFVDSWHVAEELRQKYPEDFHILTRVPATFQKIHFDREHPVYMRYQRPHLVLSQQGQLTAVNWSPAFEGPLSVPEEDVEPYYQAYHRFASLIETSSTRSELRLNLGDLICFNNRRILHGRRGFRVNGGQRHLQGCYVNIDEFKCEVEVLSRMSGDGRPASRVGNQCSL